MLFRFFIIVSCLTSGLSADPWGKDADLADKHVAVERITTAHCLPLAEMLIDFHQEVISPADGPRSHFKPSSSQYTLDAMRKYGFLTGYIMGCDRLMRENNEEWVYPLCKGDYGACMKYDPVP
jgi:putative component of membrane protein insertase Oxa1/YidC/SpoIIIJ protein YidD